MGLKPVEWTLTLLVASLAAYCIRKHVITAEEEQQGIKNNNLPYYSLTYFSFLTRASQGGALTLHENML